ATGSNTALYTAPATVSSQQSVTVTATSQADGATAGMATVTLSPAPVVTAISPASGQQGQVLTGVLITGQFTHFGASSAVTFGNTGIAASSIAVTDATHLTTTITIAAGVAPGLSSVTVTTGTETATGNIVFTVNPGTPAVSAISP